jgi:hypothetical protein
MSSEVLQRVNSRHRELRAELPHRVESGSSRCPHPPKLAGAEVLPAIMVSMPRMLKGHEFIEAVRDENTWEANKRKAKSLALSDLVSAQKIERDPALQENTRFIKDVGLVPIILSEQPNKGATIIEKFERNSDVGFAVVLLSGDDVGGKTASDLNAHQPADHQATRTAIKCSLSRFRSIVPASDCRPLLNYHGISKVSFEKIAEERRY